MARKKDAQRVVISGPPNFGQAVRCMLIEGAVQPTWKPNSEGFGSVRLTWRSIWRLRGTAKACLARTRRTGLRLHGAIYADGRTAVIWAGFAPPSRRCMRTDKHCGFLGGGSMTVGILSCGGGGRGGGGGGGVARMRGA